MNRLRIVGGEFKGRVLRYPRGARIRPTAEAVREALFSALQEYVGGARFADLFAGTGAVGLEALSRGATRAVLIEKNPRCVQAIRLSAANLGAGERLVIVAGTVEEQWERAAEEHGPFDLVFADPPYAYAGWEHLAARLLEERVGLTEEAIVVFEYAWRRPPRVPQEAWRQKQFGETGLSFYRK